jgi:hypothetical protein
MPPPGIVFMNVDAPISTVVAGESLGSRSGESSASSILGIAAWGDASVQAAARNGGIQQPRHIDYRFLSVLGLYQRFTTVVRGE